MDRIPRIASIEIAGATELLVLFDNGAEKIYDVNPLLARPAFQPLANPAIFKTVRVDAGGYGISWNDDIDLSEYEIWTHGRDRANRDA
jgi:Protein of unknown function (DUF2442)